MTPALQSVVRRTSLNNRCLFYSNLLSKRSAFSSPSPSTASSSQAFSESSDPHLASIRSITKSFRFASLFKFTLIGTIAGALATAGYATFAYSTDEVDEKTKDLRSSIKQSMVDASFTINTLPHLIYISAMSVPCKAVNLYLDLRRSTEERIQEFAEPYAEKLLPDMVPVEEQNRVFTLILDLNETLICTEWKRETGWYTFKRPGLDDFLEHLAQIYEIVVYSDKILEEQIIYKLMEKGVRYVLQRPATKYQDGKFFRDLSKLNRDPKRVLYVSGYALESCLQPENSVPIKPWKKEVHDTVLIDLIPFLEYVGINKPADIREVISNYQGTDIPTEFINRSKKIQRHYNKQRVFPWSRDLRS
ncbi:mitochondrial import inner membrane translocase subunit TIM50-like [Amaranthus tricolor]|uniref:mitochondrial import inner membrane translocase subunit TIM50-like n=1 Tax=Amaranthus tricolor TaxID=29722 RepID=UPI00258AF425|nr:mitochondrial import inner membrane translocase subunit TIM50-like [Amaranthus tricolor]